MAELVERFLRTTMVVATNYRGLSVAEITQLRRRLREAGVEYRVVKNTLARLAAERAVRPGIVQLLDGPTGLALGYGEGMEPAKALLEYARSSRTSLIIRGALVDGRVLSPAEVEVLATLPPREVLLAQVTGAVQAPLARLVGTLSAVLRQFMGVIQARIDQLEHSEGEKQ